MTQEPRYFIRQTGGTAQGPYDFSKIKGYRDAGRISPEMDFSEDGETWWKGSDWPALFPATAPKPPPMPQQRATQPRSRPDRAQRRPRRQQRRSRSGPLIAVIVVIAAGVAVAIALSGKDKAPPSPRGSASTASSEPEPLPRTRTRTPDVPVRREAKAPPAPDPRAALLKKRGTKRQFRKKIAEVMESPGGIGYGDEDEFVKRLGEPDKTQTVGDSIYWYYACTNGTIQVVIAGVLHHGGGLVVTAINDF